MKQQKIFGTSKRATVLISLGLMIILVGLGLVCAESIGTFKQGSSITLPQLCATCTSNNITNIVNPSGTIIISNKVMTKAGSWFNYTLDSAYTTVLGTYTVNGIGDLDGVDTVWTYSFDVTPVGGPENNLTIFLILLIISVSVFLLSLLLKNYIFAIIGGFGLMAAGMYGIIYGFGDITSLYTRIISYIIIGVGIIITVTSALELMQEMYGGNSNEEDDE